MTDNDIHVIDQLMRVYLTLAFYSFISLIHSVLLDSTWQLQLPAIVSLLGMEPG